MGIFNRDQYRNIGGIPRNVKSVKNTQTPIPDENEKTILQQHT